MKIFKPATAHAAKKDGTWTALATEIDQLPSEEAVLCWREEFVTRKYRELPEDWQETILGELEDRLVALKHEALDEAFRGTVAR